MTVHTPLAPGPPSRRPPRPHDRRGRPRRWSDAELADAVARSTTVAEVTRRLGISHGGASQAAVKRRMHELGLSLGDGPPSQAVLAAQAGPRRRWTDDDLAAAVAGSSSIAGTLRLLGLQPGGSVYGTIRRRIEQLGLDTSHHTGKGWRRGSDEPVTPPRSLEEVLVEDSRANHTSDLRRRLIREGLLEPRCAECGGTEWCGQPMPLQLDHVNGVRTDNRLENLRLLCPNCHSLTPTWCGKNRGRYTT